MTFFVIFFVLFAMPARASAATVYADHLLGADCAGNYSISARNCSGSNGNAFNTIDECADALSPGDTCSVRAGTYTETVAPGSNGTAANYKILKNHNGESVTIVGPGGTSGYAVNLDNRSWWRVEGFTIKAPAAFACLRALALADASLVCQGEAGVDTCGIQVVNNVFTDCTPAVDADRSAIFVSAQEGRTSRGHLIQGNTVTNFARHAINIRRSKYTVIEKNIIDNSGSTKFQVGTNTASWTGIALSSGPTTSNNIVRNNYIHDLVDESVVASNPKAVWCDVGGSDNVITNNVIYKINGGNAQVNDGRGIFDEHSCKRTIASRNIIVEAGTGINTANNTRDEDLEISFNAFHGNRSWDICPQKSERVVVTGNIFSQSNNRVAFVKQPISGNTTGTPLSGADKLVSSLNFYPNTNSPVARLDLGDGEFSGSCPQNVVPNRTVLQLEAAATNETDTGRGGWGETGASSRKVAVAGAWLDPTNSAFESRNYNPRDVLVDACGTAPSGYVGAGWDCGPYEIPQVLSATIGDAGTLTVCFANFYDTLTPATGITGFSGTLNGGAWTLGTGTLSSPNCVAFTPSPTADSDDVLRVSYAGGGVFGKVDMGGFTGDTWQARVKGFTDFAVDNQITPGSGASVFSSTHFRWYKAGSPYVVTDPDVQVPLSSEDTAATVAHGADVVWLNKIVCSGGAGDCVSQGLRVYYSLDGGAFTQMTGTCSSIAPCFVAFADIPNGQALSTERLTSGFPSQTGRLYNVAGAIAVGGSGWEDTEMEIGVYIHIPIDLSATTVDFRWQLENGDVLAGGYPVGNNRLNLVPPVMLRQGF